MSINLDDYPKFKADLEGKDTNLIPLVVVWNNIVDIRNRVSPCFNINTLF